MVRDYPEKPSGVDQRSPVTPVDVDHHEATGDSPSHESPETLVFDGCLPWASVVRCSISLRADRAGGSSASEARQAFQGRVLDGSATVLAGCGMQSKRSAREFYEFEKATSGDAGQGGARVSYGRSAPAHATDR